MSRPLSTPAGDPRSIEESRSDGGFTLVELLVVVLILGVLLAIGIPTFQGAVQRSADRKAQAHVRQTYVVQLTHASDAQAFTDDVTELEAVDATLTYTPDLTPLATGAASPKVVFVDVATDTQPNDTVVMAARSSTGSCYWVKATLNTPVSYATNDCSAAPDPAELKPRW